MDGVRQWLRSMNIEKYASKFEYNDYDDMESIRSLTQEDVNEMLLLVKCTIEDTNKIINNLFPSNDNPYQQVATNFETPVQNPYGQVSSVVTTLDGWLEPLGLKEYAKKLNDEDYETIGMIKKLNNFEVNEMFKAIGATPQAIVKMQQSLFEMTGKSLESDSPYKPMDMDIAPSAGTNSDQTTVLESKNQTTVFESTNSNQLQERNTATQEYDDNQYEGAFNFEVPEKKEKSIKPHFIPLVQLRKQQDVVCKIQYVDENGKDIDNCGSGFLASFGKEIIGIMTNNHVFASREECKLRYAIFRFGEMRKGKDRSFRIRFKPDIFFFTSKDLDCSFVACDTNYKKQKPKMDPYPLLKNLRSEVIKGEQIHIYQHPAGRKKEKSQIDVFRVKPKTFFYQCDTEGGSSGSPVFCGAGIAGLHHGSKTIAVGGGRREKCNEAIGMTLILDALLHKFVASKSDEDRFGLTEEDRLHIDYIIKKKKSKTVADIAKELGKKDLQVQAYLYLQKNKQSNMKDEDNDSVLKAESGSNTRSKNNIPKENAFNPYASDASIMDTRIFDDDFSNDDDKVINPYAQEQWDTEPDNPYAPADFKIEVSEHEIKKHSAEYCTIKDLRKQKWAVCKIEMPRGECGTGFFGFMEGRRGIMTNNHVFPNPKKTETAVAIFRYNGAEEGSKKDKSFRIKFKASTFFWTNKDLDATFVECEHQIIEDEGIQPLPLAVRDDAEEGNQIHIYQHPSGKPKARAQSGVLDVVTKEINGEDLTYITYEADTEPGSSGSPVFCGQFIVGLHHAGKKKISTGGKLSRYNEAVAFNIIYEKLYESVNGEGGETEILMKENATITIESLDEDDKELIDGLLEMNKAPGLIAKKLGCEVTLIKMYIQSTSMTNENFARPHPVKPKKAVEVIQYMKAPDWQYLNGLKDEKKIKAILESEANYQTFGKTRELAINKKVWEKVEIQLRESKKAQRNGIKFPYNNQIHRFPDIYPYDYNSMPNGIGSWMGDCFGMMQWPTPGVKNNKILQKMVTENNVGMIVALGKQNQNERLEMINYWETLGTDYEETKVEHLTIREVTGIPPNDHACSLFHFRDWEDNDSPTQNSNDFDYLFKRIQEKERESKRILIHCRAGVGRSGTLRLMYKAWKRDFTIDTLAEEFIKQRALRMSTVQRNVQYIFIRKYMESLSFGALNTNFVDTNQVEKHTEKKIPDIAEWLTGLNLGRYLPLFEENDYDDMKFLLEMDKSQLNDMFTTIDELTVGARIKIEKGLQDLREGKTDSVVGMGSPTSKTTSVLNPYLYYNADPGNLGAGAPPDKECRREFILMDVKQSAEEVGWQIPRLHQPIDLTKKFTVNGECSIPRVIERIKVKPDTPPVFYLRRSSDNRYYKIEVAVTKLEIIVKVDENDSRFKTAEKWAINGKKFSVSDVLDQTVQQIQEGKQLPSIWYTLLKNQKRVNVEIKRERALVINSVMPKDWTPSSEDKDETQEYTRNGKCSVMFCLHQANLKLKKGIAMPPVFYVRSTSHNVYFKIEVTFQSEQD